MRDIFFRDLVQSTPEEVCHKLASLRLVAQDQKKTAGFSWSDLKKDLYGLPGTIADGISSFDPKYLAPIGAGVGGLYGLASELMQPEEERDYSNALLTAAAGGALGGVGGLAIRGLSEEPSVDPRQVEKNRSHKLKDDARNSVSSFLDFANADKPNDTAAGNPNDTAAGNPNDTAAGNPSGNPGEVYDGPFADPINVGIGTSQGISDAANKIYSAPEYAGTRAGIGTGLALSGARFGRNVYLNAMPGSVHAGKIIPAVRGTTTAPPGHAAPIPAVTQKQLENILSTSGGLKPVQADQLAQKLYNTANPKGIVSSVMSPIRLNMMATGKSPQANAIRQLVSARNTGNVRATTGKVGYGSRMLIPSLLGLYHDYRMSKKSSLNKAALNWWQTAGIGAGLGGGVALLRELQKEKEDRDFSNTLLGAGIGGASGLAAHTLLPNFFSSKSNTAPKPPPDTASAPPPATAQKTPQKTPQNTPQNTPSADSEAVSALSPANAPPIAVPTEAQSKSPEKTPASDTPIPSPQIHYNNRDINSRNYQSPLTTAAATAGTLYGGVSYKRELHNIKNRLAALKNVPSVQSIAKPQLDQLAIPVTGSAPSHIIRDGIHRTPSEFTARPDLRQTWNARQRADIFEIANAEKAKQIAAIQKKYGPGKVRWGRVVGPGAALTGATSLLDYLFRPKAD